ncbi:MAG: hypothetical protein DSZ07_02070 [Sulfurovum sp.]|nr:MAG: hypothetical protein DSZ07_02070 [Sulfurovum sp.]
MQNKKRLIGLDVFRGWAIVLMVIFHFSYDIYYFNIIDFQIQTNTFFIWFRFLIVSIFLLTVGMSLKLAHQTEINWSSLKERTLYLGVASFLVTISSYIIFPNSWIYFGILHFILVASFIVLPLLNYPYLSLIIAITTFIAFHLNILNMHWLFNILVTPLHLPPTISVDVVRFVPWISFVLVGISMVSLGWHQRIFNRGFFNKRGKLNNFFSFLGKHSLLIYIIHQPILFGIFILLKEVKLYN